jgi:hypothetical protein
MPTRREFAKAVALATVSGAVLPASADTASPNAFAALVKAQSGRYLTSDEMKRVRSDFAEYAKHLESFRAFKLTNGDEPDVTFQALAKRWP